MDPEPQKVQMNDQKPQTSWRNYRQYVLPVLGIAFLAIALFVRNYISLLITLLLSVFLIIFLIIKRRVYKRIILYFLIIICTVFLLLAVTSVVFMMRDISKGYYTFNELFKCARHGGLLYSGGFTVEYFCAIGRTIDAKHNCQRSSECQNFCAYRFDMLQYDQPGFCAPYTRVIFGTGYTHIEELYSN